MYKVTLYLTSGAEIVFTCKDFTMSSRPDGTIAKYAYEGLTGRVNPMHVNLNHVIAVTTDKISG